MKYAILDEQNIAMNIYDYSQSLNNKPNNYIVVEDDSMRYHKFENGVWSIESYAPAPGPDQISQMDQIQNTVDMILLKQEGIL